MTAKAARIKERKLFIVVNKQVIVTTTTPTSTAAARATDRPTAIKKRGPWRVRKNRL